MISAASCLYNMLSHFFDLQWLSAVPPHSLLHMRLAPHAESFISIIHILIRSNPFASVISHGFRHACTLANIRRRVDALSISVMQRPKWRGDRCIFRSSEVRLSSPMYVRAKSSLRPRSSGKIFQLHTKHTHQWCRRLADMLSYGVGMYNHWETCVVLPSKM